jgi:3-phenylpropionate/trans-cinnamate dioxygenase ferredoxin reductase subunit
MLAMTDTDKRSYAEIQSVWSDQYEFKIQMAGIFNGDEQIIRGDMASEKFMIFWLNDDVISGVLAVNQPKQMRPSQNLIKNKSKVDKEQLADETTNLKKIAV